MVIIEMESNPDSNNSNSISTSSPNNSSSSSSSNSDGAAALRSEHQLSSRASSSTEESSSSHSSPDDDGLAQSLHRVTFSQDRNLSWPPLSTSAPGPTFMTDRASRISFGTEGLEVTTPHDETVAKYRYENTLLKTELAHKMETWERERKEFINRHNAEMQALERERDEAASALLTQQEAWGVVERRLLQKNMVLEEKMQHHTEERAALQHQLEAAEHAKRLVQEDLHAQKEACVAKLERCKAEKTSASIRASERAESLEAERSLGADLRAALDREKHQMTLLQSRLREVEQEARVQLEATEAEVDSLKQLLRHQGDQHDTKLREMAAATSEAESRFASAERRATAREEELTERLMRLQEEHSDAVARHAQAIERLHTARLAPLQAPTALSTAATPITSALNYQQQLQDLTDQRAQLRGVSTKLQLRESELSKMEGELQEVKLQLAAVRREAAQAKKDGADKDGRLKTLTENLDKCRQQLSSAQKAHAARECDLFQQVSEVRVAQAEDESRQQEESQLVRARVHVLENRLLEKTKKFHDENRALKEKSRQYGALIRKLRHRLQVCQATRERLEAQRAALTEDRVDPLLYHQLRRDLTALNKKQAQFASYLRGVHDREAMQESAEFRERAAAIDAMFSDIERRMAPNLSARPRTESF